MSEAAVRHVVIGNGPAGVIACETIRKADLHAKITLVGSESEVPYSRMALPYLLADNISEDGTRLRHDKNYFSGREISLVTDRARQINTRDNCVAFESGKKIDYDRLLIATGSHAIRPPVPGIELPGIENCWTLKDAREISARLAKGSDVVLLGAGFIGCIVLEALAARDVNLTVIERDDRMVPRMVNHTGGDMLKRWCVSKGVNVLISTLVTDIAEAHGRLQLTFSDGVQVFADTVVCAAGVQPNITFLDGSGIKTDSGVLVDEYLRTSVANVFAAGDVAQGPEFFTGNREIHAIQPTASEHGRIAGLNMTDNKTKYAGSLSMNVLNTLGLITVSFGQWQGIAGSELAEQVDEKNHKYLRLVFADDTVVGALSIGTTQHVGVLRGLMQSKTRLGSWKARLMKNPHQIMEAYLACTQGSAAAY